MANFLGLPYPTVKTPLGYWYSQSGLNQIKSDMLCLLLTAPGERVMLPDFGTPLKRLIFEQNDAATAESARQMIIDSIRKWEPRVAITDVEVSTTAERSSLNKDDDLSQEEHILFIRILFRDPENIQVIQELVLNLPMEA